MKKKVLLQWAATLCAAFIAIAAQAADKKPNIVFIITDQRSDRLFAGADYSLPGLDTIARHGVTFQNHYISSAMCSPSRASFLSGQPPQVTRVLDQMQYPFVTSLSPDLPNMGIGLERAWLPDCLL